MRKISCVCAMLVSFACVDRSHGEFLPGQIRVDPKNANWLVRHQDENGDGRLDPVFMAGPGDPEGFLYRGTRQEDGTRGGTGADQMSLINKLAASGANSIYLQAVRSHGGDGGSSENPFNDPSNPNSGLNAAILDQWETWFTAMDEAGIVTYFFVYDDSARPFGNKDRTSIEDSEQAFIEGLVNRFERQKNLIWNIAEEYGEAHGPTAVSKIAQIIRDADDYDHVIAVHQNDSIVFDFPDDPNIDQFAIQRNIAGNDAIHNQMVSAFAMADGRFNINMSESEPHFNERNPNRQATRQYSWAVAMGGSYVMVLDMDIVNTPQDILADHGVMVAFLEQTRINDMAPHDELALAQTLYVLANPGDSYIAYAADLDGGVLGLRDLRDGPYDLFWLDVATGATMQQQGMMLSAGDHVFSGPDGFGDELALYVVYVPEPASLWVFVVCGVMLKCRRGQRNSSN